MSRALDCLGLGIAPADILLRIKDYPPPGAKIDALDIAMQGGGPIPTAMVTLARLGKKPGLIAAVGDDIMGRFVLEQLHREGVDISHIIIKRQPTAVAVGWVEKKGGRRTIVLNLKLKVRPQDINFKSLSYCRAVHLDGRDMPACLKLARWAKSNNIPVVFDIGSKRNDITEILPLVDHLVCAADFALPYTGTKKAETAINRLRRICAGTIIITSGIKGSLGYDEISGYIGQRAFKVPAVDTTGAGDVYHGAYIYGLLERWDLKSRMEFAAASSAIKCTRPGGRSGIPSLNQVRSFLRKGNPSYA